MDLVGSVGIVEEKENHERIICSEHDAGAELGGGLGWFRWSF